MVYLGIWVSGVSELKQQIYTYFFGLALAASLVTGSSSGALGDTAQGAACSGVSDAPMLDISVVNLRSSKGLVTITLYPDEAKKFLAPRAKVSRLRIAAQEPVTRACMPVPKAGGYAIAIYHDEDGDRKFNRTMMGLPEEGYGFSNDALAVVGLPSFTSVRFEATPDITPLRITMRY
jgi:uncharacterized protein (DUF2141 family)